jgi:hypothetical protein
VDTFTHPNTSCLCSNWTLVDTLRALAFVNIIKGFCIGSSHVFKYENRVEKQNETENQLK